MRPRLSSFLSQMKVSEEKKNPVSDVGGVVVVVPGSWSSSSLSIFPLLFRMKVMDRCSEILPGDSIHPCRLEMWEPRLNTQSARKKKEGKKSESTVGIV